MVKIVFLGAGSAVFTRQLVTDLLRFDDLPALDIVMHDISEERQDVAVGTAANVSKQLGRAVDVTGESNRKRALTDADFVVNMIQVEGIEGTRKDLLIPFDMGLKQTIGDTTGVGGIFRGLRTFPVLDDIAADMREVCPDAYLLSYTNPMCMNIWWLQDHAPDIHSFGLCHSIHWTVHDLCELIGVPMGEVTYLAGGVNHQSWLTVWERDGKSLYPLLDERIAGDENLHRRVRVEMYKRLGYYPTETSEHSSEYLDWFLRSEEQIQTFRLEPLEYLGISEENLAQYHEAKVLLSRGEDLPLHSPDDAAEYAPQIIHSVVTGTPRQIFVNTKNVGLIDNLAADAVVEVSASVDAQGVHPQHFGRVPTAGASLNQRYLDVARLTIEGAQQGDRDLIRRAALLDPNASSTLTPEQIWAVCDRLFEAHADYLPQSLR